MLTYIHHTCMHACIHACIHTYMGIYKHTHTYIYTRARTHTHIYLYVHTHIHRAAAQNSSAVIADFPTIPCVASGELVLTLALPKGAFSRLRSPSALQRLKRKLAPCGIVEGTHDGSVLQVPPPHLSLSPLPENYPRPSSFLGLPPSL